MRPTCLATTAWTRSRAPANGLGRLHTLLSIDAEQYTLVFDEDGPPQVQSYLADAAEKWAQSPSFGTVSFEGEIAAACESVGDAYFAAAP